MKKCYLLGLLIALFIGSCSDSESNKPTPPTEAGKITVSTDTENFLDCVHLDLPTYTSDAYHHDGSQVRFCLSLRLAVVDRSRHGAAHLPSNSFQDLADYACQSGHHYQKRIKNRDTTLFKNRIANIVG